MPDEPYIRPEERLPEFTAKAIVLGMALSMLLAAANAYLGLKVGMTVSASIPAAVISMAVLKLFKRSNILENNLVQTAASAGESLAAGAIFTLPALVLAGSWRGFPYGTVTAITLVGGLLGVLFSIPLRRALVTDRPLAFPEGVATAEVLKAGDRGGHGIRLIVAAAAAGFLVKVAQGGLRIVAGGVSGAFRAGKAVVAGGCDLSPALVAVGYIVRLDIAATVFAGGLCAWGLAIPLYSAVHGLPPAESGYAAAFSIWSTHIRYAGVGAMFVGGIWSLVVLMRPLVHSMRAAYTAHCESRRSGGTNVSRVERDIAPLTVLAGIVALIPVAYGLMARLIAGTGGAWWVALVALALLLVAGFLFSGVAAYMAGLVGSSNNPVSGVTIATVLVTGLVMVPCLGAAGDPARALAAVSATLLVAAGVCCAAAISGDNLQDLKAGHMLGATPFKQQLMQMLGVAAAAVIIAPTLNLLYQAYGIGASFPRPNMDPAQALAAPQASLMYAVAHGIAARDLPWAMMAAGGVLAGAVILLDGWLARRQAGVRIPVLALAVGIYLPIELTFPIFLGGCLSGRARAQAPGGLLAASGLIAGEALAGVFLAIPFALAQRTDVLAVAPRGLGIPGQVLGILLLAGLGGWLRLAGRPPPEDAGDPAD